METMHVDLLRELNQNGSFAVLLALEKRKRSKNKKYAAFTFTKISNEKPGIIFHLALN